MRELLHWVLCSTVVPGFPVLSLPVGASNDVCSRTIALHSAPWQMVGHSDELASGDTGTEGQGGAFYIISQGPPQKIIDNAFVCYILSFCNARWL